jgi:hypothetical protein
VRKVLKYAAVAFVVLVVWGGLIGQQRETRLLRQEVQALRSEVRDLAQRRIATTAPVERPNDFGAVALGIQRSEEERAELEKLKADVATMKQRAQDFARAAGVTPGAGKIIPVSDWKNAGRDTPQSGLETALWAATGGEVETLAGSLTFTASARQKADAFFAGLSENTRQQYGSAEKLLALMISKDASSVAGMAVLGQKEVTPDDVGMRVRFANDEGKTKEQSFLLHRGNAGWQLVLNDDAVEKFAKQVSGKK